MKELESIMAAVKTARLSEVNHGKCEHSALGRDLGLSLAFALSCLLLQCLMLQLFSRLA